MKKLIILLFPLYLLGQNCNDLFEKYGEYPGFTEQQVRKARRHLSTHSFELWMKAYITTHQGFDGFELFLAQTMIKHPETYSSTASDFVYDWARSGETTEPVDTKEKSKKK